MQKRDLRVDLILEVQPNKQPVFIQREQSDSRPLYQGNGLSKFVFNFSKPKTFYLILLISPFHTRRNIPVLL